MAPVRWRAYTGFLGVLSILICTLLLKRQTARVSHPPVPLEYLEDLPGCTAIINGNLEGTENKFIQLMSSSSPKTLQRKSYPNVTEDCKAYVTRRGFFTMPLSVEEQDFPIAYSMVIHEKVEMFERPPFTILRIFTVSTWTRSLLGTS